MPGNDRHFEDDLIEELPATNVVASIPHTQTDSIVSKDNSYKKRNKRDTLKSLRCKLNKQ